ncbi:MAG: hypothetical protein R3F59_06675 [Myxococcota bacterium]
MREPVRATLRGVVLAESYTARGSCRFAVEVPRRGPMCFELVEHASDDLRWAERDVRLTVSVRDLHRVLGALVDGPVEPRDPDLSSRLLDALARAVDDGRFPTSWIEVRRWLDARGVPYVERRWTVTRSDPG